MPKIIIFEFTRLSWVGVPVVLYSIWLFDPISTLFIEPSIFLFKFYFLVGLGHIFVTVSHIRAHKHFSLSKHDVTLLPWVPHIFQGWFFIFRREFYFVSNQTFLSSEFIEASLPWIHVKKAFDELVFQKEKFQRNYSFLWLFTISVFSFFHPLKTLINLLLLFITYYNFIFVSFASLLIVHCTFLL